MAQGKKYSDAVRRYDRAALHEPDAALDLVGSLATCNFDESIDVVFGLGVDPRKADQMVRGTVALPSGTGGVVRVLVFCQGDAVDEAKAAGADLVGAEELAKEVEGGMFDFDIAIATPDMMPLVGKLGRVLGPRGLMPNPKTGTVTTDVTKAVTEFKGGRVEYRTDRHGGVALAIGKASFSGAELMANYQAVVDELERARPASAKGRYFRKVTISPTMGPAIRVNPPS